MEKIRIYYLGAGEIAATVLAGLINAPEIELCGVGTQIDRPAGRKKVLTPTPVAQQAGQYGLNPDKIPNVNQADFLAELKKLDLDFIVVISFGQLLKSEILNLPKFGCINIHGSILPKYRGASPIISAILDGEKETGITFMQMAATMDTGDIYEICRCEIAADETAAGLELKLGKIGAEKIAKVLQKIKNGQLTPCRQEHNLATICRKIKKNHGIIDWEHATANQIENMCRAFYPWPGASATLELANHNQIKVTICRACPTENCSEMPGTLLQADKSHFKISCANGTSLEILSLNVPGKREMSAKEFLNGYKVIGIKKENLS